MSIRTAVVGNPEIWSVANSIAAEKSIPQEKVIGAIERAIESAAKKKYGDSYLISASVEPKTGSIKIKKQRTVVADVLDNFKEISLEEAKYIDKDAKIADVIFEELPPINLGRVVAQTVKQVIISEVKAVEKEKEYDYYKDKVGEIINGIVKKVDFEGILIDVAGAEALLPKKSLIPGEIYKHNDRIRAVIDKVEKNLKASQIILSRASGKFLEKLFTQEVPEIYDNIIQIKAVARDPGSRAKIAVYTPESNIDPVGACVGARGSRVQSVIAELRGEKIDIIEWSSDPATFAVNALTPAEISKVVIDEDSNKIEVILPDDQLSVAIGRKGQNVKLASKITGWDIDILTEAEESKLRVGEFASLSNLFKKALDIDEVMAHFLVSEGFSSIDEMTMVEVSDLTSLENINEEFATLLIGKANEYCEKERLKIAEYKKSSVETKFILMLNKDIDVIDGFVKNGIKNIANLSNITNEMSWDMLKDIAGVTIEQAEMFVLKAKKMAK